MKEPELLAGRYLLEKVLGEGTYSKVRLAKDLTNGNRIAIKMIKKEKKHATTICREQLAQHLDHPNIVDVLHSFETEDSFCVVMTLMKNSLEQELHDDIKRLVFPGRRLSSSSCRELLVDLVEAIHYLHYSSEGRKGVSFSHRDIKSGNVLINFNERYQLCDFGLCNVSSDVALFQTNSVGSALYLSPDFLRFRSGEFKKYDGFALDYWSLGVLLYEASTGTFPFLPPPQEIHSTSAYSILCSLIIKGNYDESLVEDHILRRCIKLLLNPDPVTRRRNFLSIYSSINTLM
ncbi:hypothetical protein RCL1_008207 [Eukaryota sp. TZLM3-RCL]